MFAATPWFNVSHTLIVAQVWQKSITYPDADNAKSPLVPMGIMATFRSCLAEKHKSGMIYPTYIQYVVKCLVRHQPRLNKKGKDMTNRYLSDAASLQLLSNYKTKRQKKRETANKIIVLSLVAFLAFSYLVA